MHYSYEEVYEKVKKNNDFRTKLIETRNQKEIELSLPDFGLEENEEIKKMLVDVREEVKKEVLQKIILNCQNKKVYVIGHSHPDADSIFSSLLLTHILKSKGIDAVFAVRDTIFVHRELINDYVEEKYEIVTDFTDKYFFLVDHNDLNGIPKEQVIGAIDHHRITGEVENLIEIEYASTALLIYDLFRDQYHFSREELLFIALAIFTDTEYLISPRFGEEDRKLYEELSLNLDEKFYQKKYFKTTDFTKSISENLKKDYKEYEIDGRIIQRSMITSYCEEKNRFYESYVDNLSDNPIHLLIWCDYEEKKTFIHFKNHDFVFPFFTTSTNLVIKYLKEKNYL